jgi:predicted helicase
LDLVEVLDWAGDALTRVDRGAFFQLFEEQHAVTYFYEPFLEANNPVLKKQLGVWFTPPKIVRYMVERVDRALRTELGIEAGLADPRVYVLDLCCGTGAYPVEVLRRIARTLTERGEGALAAEELKHAALTRVFGFEILPAPFVIAHLQLGLLLQEQGTPLSDAGRERAAIYLTNALTGWAVPTPSVQQAPLAPELLAERDAAEHVKRDAPILVVLGNPPYNAFAGVSPAEELGLVEPYKAGLVSRWGIRKFNLDELYVRFFRVAQRRIADTTGEGIVCFISNFSYLSDPSFATMREHLLGDFDSLWFDSLNGDSRETGKRTPDGLSDPSIFSTETNREGIRVGTSVSLLVKHSGARRTPTVRYRQFWGVAKRSELLDSLDALDFESSYQPVTPIAENRFSFRPMLATDEYRSWPTPQELCDRAPISGLLEMRHGALIDIDRNALERRLRAYYDPSIDWFLSCCVADRQWDRVHRPLSLAPLRRRRRTSPRGRVATLPTSGSRTLTARRMWPR